MVIGILSWEDKISGAADLHDHLRQIIAKSSGHTLHSDFSVICDRIFIYINKEYK